MANQPSPEKASDREREKAHSRSKSYEMVKIVRRGGPTGCFDIDLDGPDGPFRLECVRRRFIASQANAMQGRAEPQCQAAYRLYGWLLGQFPSLPPKLPELRAFADKVGFDLGKEEQPVKAWELLFGESGLIFDGTPGAVAAITEPPK